MLSHNINIVFLLQSNNSRLWVDISKLIYKTIKYQYGTTINEYCFPDAGKGLVSGGLLTKRALTLFL